MKTIITISISALLISLSISCKKENSTVQTSGITSESISQDVLNDNKVLAGNTVRIGTQVWMKKNLDVTRYRNGDKIPQVKDRHKWASLTTGAWCWYNNDSATGAVYGKLYNWYAVHDPRGLAPEGWHVPSEAEWTTLSTYLGGYAVAGGKMKSTGTIEAGTGLWYAPNADATNSSGFTALPGGYHHFNDYYIESFYGAGITGFWWSTTEYTLLNYAWYHYINYGGGTIYADEIQKTWGFSVRCVKD